MALTGGAAYAMSHKYTEDTVIGLGALMGKPCRIKSIDDTVNPNIVTFAWTDDNTGTDRTSTLKVKNGVTPVVGANGHWWVDGEDTGLLVEGITPHIGDNGNWYIGEEDTTKPSRGVSISGFVKIRTDGLTNYYKVAYSDGTFSNEIPIINGATKTSELDNDEEFITKDVNNLVNYYLKKDLYTKEEVTDLIKGVGGLGTKVVTELPVTDINPLIIYLIEVKPKLYSLNMYINNVWASLGSTSGGGGTEGIFIDDDGDIAQE